jgi:hypothetical protein
MIIITIAAKYNLAPPASFFGDSFAGFRVWFRECCLLRDPMIGLSRCWFHLVRTTLSKRTHAHTHTLSHTHPRWILDTDTGRRALLELDTGRRALLELDTGTGYELMDTG